MKTLVTSVLKTYRRFYDEYQVNSYKNVNIKVPEIAIEALKIQNINYGLSIEYYGLINSVMTNARIKQSTNW